MIQISINKAKVKTWRSFLGHLFLSVKQMICQTANYLNNHKLLHSKYCLCADDSNRITSEINIEALEVHTFKDISMIQHYFNKDKLYLNSKKTNFMTFLTKKGNKYLI